jgi:hypothetical protein
MTLNEAKALAAAQGTKVVHRMLENYTTAITRETRWGNPHRAPLGPFSQEREALAYVRGLDDATLARCGDLRGETLGCWCAPRMCHGDVLATLAAVDTVEERRVLLVEWERALEEAT